MIATPRLVARIGRPHGLRGEVTVQLHTDDPANRLAPGSRLDTEAPGGSGVPTVLTVATSRLHRAVWLVGFEEVPDRTGAEGLRGTRLFLRDGSVGEERGTGDHGFGSSGDDDEAWFEEELVGLSAYDPTGARIGEVSGLETRTAQDLLVLTLEDGHRVLVPFVRAIVPEVDLAGGRVVVDAPEGLLDLGREA